MGRDKSPRRKADSVSESLGPSTNFSSSRSPVAKKHKAVPTKAPKKKKKAKKTRASSDVTSSESEAPVSSSRSSSSSDSSSDKPKKKTKAKPVQKDKKPAKAKASARKAKGSGSKNTRENSRMVAERGGVFWFGETAKVEVSSPANVMEVLHEEFGHDMFDPCPLIRPDWNGLKRKWGRLNYINPPFDQVQEWTLKAIKECRSHDCTCVFFFPSRTSSRYWEENVYANADEIRFVSGSIRFPAYPKNCPFPMCFLVFRSGPRIRGEIAPAPPRPDRDILTDEEILADPTLQGTLLWFAANNYKTITRPSQIEFIEWRRKWATRRISTDQLFRKYASDPKSTFSSVYFSLFLQLCEAEHRVFGASHGASRPTDVPNEQLTFFRMLSSIRSTMGPFAEGLRKLARVPDCSVTDVAKLMKLAESKKWLVKACHFYIVYREYREEEWRRAARVNYTKASFDAKFSQNVIFFN